MGHHFATQNEQHGSEEGGQRVPGEVPCQVEHEQARQEKVSYDLDLDESERKRGKERYQCHHPVWRIEDLGFRIGNNGEAGKRIGQPKRQTKVSQFFVDISQVGIKKIPRIPWKHSPIGKEYFPMKEKNDHQQQRGSPPARGAQQTTHSQPFFKEVEDPFQKPAKKRCGTCHDRQL
jgi:hypothetical protein